MQRTLLTVLLVVMGCIYLAIALTDLRIKSLEPFKPQTQTAPKAEVRK